MLFPSLNKISAIEQKLKLTKRDDGTLYRCQTEVKNFESFLARPSARNQRVDHLWRDVLRYVFVISFTTFMAWSSQYLKQCKSVTHISTQSTP